LVVLTSRNDHIVSEIGIISAPLDLKSLRRPETNIFTWNGNILSYVRQNAGVNNTNKVNISKRPNNIAIINTHLLASPISE